MTVCVFIAHDSVLQIFRQRRRSSARGVWSLSWGSSIGWKYGLAGPGPKPLALLHVASAASCVSGGSLAFMSGSKRDGKTRR